MKEKDEIIARHIGEKDKLQKALDVALDELEDCEEWFGGSKVEKQFMLERIYKAYDQIDEIIGANKVEPKPLDDIKI